MTTITVPLMTSNGSVIDNHADWTIRPEGKAFEFDIVVIQDDDEFYAQCVKLPGAYGQGDTIEETIKDISEAIEGLLEMYLEDGHIPWKSTVIEGNVVCRKRIVFNA